MLPRLRALSLGIAAQIVLGESPVPAGVERRLHEYVAGRAALGAWLPALDRLLLEYVRRPPPGEHALAALLEAGVEPDAVLDELRSLLLVAHESTACALAWTVERLARHPAGRARAPPRPGRRLR